MVEEWHIIGVIYSIIYALVSAGLIWLYIYRNLIKQKRCLKRIKKQLIMGNDDKYIKLIETTLLNLVKKVDAIDDKISLIDRQVGQLWIKSSIFGTLGGFLSMCIYIVINVYSK